MTGKQFERTLLRGLKANRMFAMRIPDAYTHKKGVDYGQKTPCDFFAVKKNRGGGVVPMLIEAKAESRKSIAFNRLEPHQLDALVKFEEFSPRCRSYVAVAFYDPLDSRYQAMYMVPISVWVREMGGDRKSLSIDTCRDDPEIIHCPRVPHRVYELSGVGK